MRSILRNAYVVVAAVLAAGGLVQVFLAGLGVFGGAANFATHRDVGYTLSLLPLVLILLALVARMPRHFAGLALVLGLQMVAQSLFVALRADQPAIAALHPVNGFLLIALAAMLAVRAWRTRSVDERVVVPPEVDAARVG